MSDPPFQQQSRQQYREQERHGEQSEERSQEQSQEQNSAPPGPPLSAPSSTAVPEPALETRQKSGFKVGKETRVVGKAGARNLSVEWTFVWVGSYRSCRFTVRTASGNALDVTVEQLAYRKNYNGIGSVVTELLPVAPIGTKGKIVAHDTVTDETLEEPFRWIRLGGIGGLWDAIKKLFWQPAK